MAEDSNAEQPENFKKWWGTTDRNLSAARSLTRDLLLSLEKNRLEEAGQGDAALDQVVREQKEKKEKVYTQAGKHMKVISLSYDRIQDVERSITQTVDSITQLTHERYKGFAHLQICTLRLELREKRPPSELFQDILSDALEAEKTLLEAQREELKGVKDEGKQLVEDLHKMRAVLSRNSGERRINILHDISSLNQKVAPLPGQKNENEEAQEDAAGAGEDKEKQLEESRQVHRDARQLLDRFAEHRKKTLEGVSKCRDKRLEAKQKTEDCLTTRVQQLFERKIDLDTQLRHVKQTIVKGERELESSYRKLAPGDTKKADKLAADSEMLDKLKKLKEQLTEEFKNKCTALEIENDCKRVNAAKAGSAQLNKDTALLRSQSAPMLRKKKNTKAMSNTLPDVDASPMGSPGGSRSLKAGAAAGMGFQ
eukprot:TRINITY_DN6660_c0_g1_i2.p1 TRINITY_DN6660_c0_g1~~TRINITY_DN6660_c0_g1_i2.p1  ORF type:complete len:425 (-),score=132.40 TRINITY_DN6660_c0_g1_i2:199-1473(-)